VSTYASDDFRPQYESEERDRALIRQELEQGVSEDQIENTLPCKATSCASTPAMMFGLTPGTCLKKRTPPRLSTSLLQTNGSRTLKENSGLSRAQSSKPLGQPPCDDLKCRTSLCTT